MHLPSPTGCQYQDVIRGLRELRADHRGVTMRELTSRIGGTDTQIRAAVLQAQRRGDVARLGRSPSGAQTYGLTSSTGLVARVVPMAGAA